MTSYKHTDNIAKGNGGTLPMARCLHATLLIHRYLNHIHYLFNKWKSNCFVNEVPLNDLRTGMFWKHPAAHLHMRCALRQGMEILPVCSRPSIFRLCAPACVFSVVIVNHIRKIFHLTPIWFIEKKKHHKCYVLSDGRPLSRPSVSIPLQGR